MKLSNEEIKKIVDITKNGCANLYHVCYACSFTKIKEDGSALCLLPEIFSMLNDGRQIIGFQNQRKGSRTIGKLIIRQLI